MAAASEIVAGHLSALWDKDWDALRQSLSNRAELVLVGTDDSDFKWDVGGLYRHVTQAWDFLPGEVDLRNDGGGRVSVEMRLTDGGGWIKSVTGEYVVSDGRICRIRLADSWAHRQDAER